MKLHTLGIDYHHDRDFVIDRPNGSGDSLILIFKTPALIRLNNDIMHAPAGSAVVFSPEYYQHYAADGDEYINHWVHFDDEGSDEFIQRIGLPLNALIPACDISATERILDLLSMEALSETKSSNASCDLLLRLLLTKLADGIGQKIEQSSHHSGALKELRALIYRNPAQSKCIDDMAAALSLSPSHFQHLYKKEFGISCYEDILTARHAMAKYYLKNTSLPISRISELCGYENDVHFIRQFRKRHNCTAMQYRKNNI